MVIPSKTWDDDKQKITSKFPLFQQYNVKLANIRSQIESLVSNYKLRREVVSKEELQANIEKIIHPDKVILEHAKSEAAKHENTLFEVFDLFIQEKTKLGELKARTLEGYA